MISRYLMCQYRNPKIEVRFDNEYGYQSVFSSTNPPQESNWPAQSVQSTATIGAIQSGLSKMQKRRPKISKSSSSSAHDSDNERHVQQQNFLRTFSAMDISKSDSSHSTSKTVWCHQGNWFRTDAVVRVRGIQSPEDFYVQCIEAAQQMRENLEKFAESPKCRPPSIIVVGQHYITVHKQNEKDHFHRALVIRKAESHESYHVFLPDIGISRKVTRNK